MTDFQIDQPLAPLTRDAPDALLAEAIRRGGREIVGQALDQAAKSCRTARNVPGPSRAGEAIWQFFRTRYRQAAGPVGRLRVALQVDAVLRALAKLPRLDPWGIGDELAGVIGDTLHNPRSDWHVSARTRAAMAGHPDLAWFQAELDAALVAQAAVWKRADVGWSEYAWERRPADLLCDLQRRRGDLTLDGKGRLTTPPGTALRVAEWIALQRHTPALVKLLADETSRRLVVT